VIGFGFIRPAHLTHYTVIGFGFIEQLEEAPRKIAPQNGAKEAGRSKRAGDPGCYPSDPDQSLSESLA
jgi:hypothetical protein